MSLLRPVCRWAGCWCREWPPSSVVRGSGARYLDELPAPEPGVRLFVYRYEGAGL